MLVHDLISQSALYSSSKSMQSIDTRIMIPNSSELHSHKNKRQKRAQGLTHRENGNSILIPLEPQNLNGSMRITRSSKYFRTDSDNDGALTIEDHRRFSYHPDDMLRTLGAQCVWRAPTRRRLLLQAVASNSSKDDNGTDVIDWPAVAKAVTDQTDLPATPMECFMLYRNLLHPDINQDQWSRDEEILLLALAERHKYHNWAAIAAELSTSRTAMQCLQHYQRVLNGSILKRSHWSEQENQVLRRALLVDGLTFQQAADLLPGRSRAQVEKHWRFSFKEDHHLEGRWLGIEEKRLVLASIAIDMPTSGAAEAMNHDSYTINADDETNDDHDHNNDDEACLHEESNSETDRDILMGANIGPSEQLREQKMDILARCVGTRSATACWLKWRDSTDPTLNEKPFTPMEDGKLLELVATHGTGDWKTIVRHFPGRAGLRIVGRWKAIGDPQEVRQYLVANELRRKSSIRVKSSLAGDRVAQSKLSAEDIRVIPTIDI